MINSLSSFATPSLLHSTSSSQRPDRSRFAKAMLVLAASSGFNPMTVSGFTPRSLRSVRRAPLMLGNGLGGRERPTTFLREHSPLNEETSFHPSFGSSSETDRSFQSKYEQLTDAFESSAWHELAECNFDLITVLTGERAGCSISPRLLPKGVTVVNRDKPIVTYNGKSFHSDVFYTQAFIFDKDEVIKLMEEAGLPTEDVKAAGRSPFEVFESFSSKHMQTYQRERILGFSHAIDTLNSEVCASFCEYVNSGDIIVSKSMLDHSKAQGWISDADIEKLHSTVESGRLTFKYSDSNVGFRLPAPLSAQRQMMLSSASEFDFGDDGSFDDEFIDESSAFDPIDERALDGVSGSTHLLLNKLYARWETLFDRVKQMPKGLPKVTAYGSSLGRRHFVEPIGNIDKRFIELHTEFQRLREGGVELT